MRVFDFTLLSGYEFSGVDVAQGFRARLFAKNNVNAKFIFTELPTIRDMELYGSQKIKRGQIMSAHLFMTGRLDMSLSVKKEALLENEKENYEYDNIDEDGKVIRLYNSGEKSVEILCDEDGFVINESLFKNGKKYLENYYTDSLSYTELYNWDNDSSDGLNLGRRIFWNKQGQMVYEQCIYKDNVEYLFKNGEVIDNVAFVERFIKELNLCENDICIMDRAGYLDYIQPLFENKGKSKLIAVLHSDHFYKIYEDESSLYMNYGDSIPIVGFDVRYGNQTFIDDGQNGYKIPITDEMDQKEKIKLLSERIVRMFTEDDMDAFSGHSYEKAKEYLTKEVVHRWIELLK